MPPDCCKCEGNKFILEDECRGCKPGEVAVDGSCKKGMISYFVKKPKL